MPRLGISLSKGKGNCHFTRWGTLFANMISTILLCIIFTCPRLKICELLPSTNRVYLPTDWIRAGLLPCFGQYNVVKVIMGNFGSNPQKPLQHFCSLSWDHCLHQVNKLGQACRKMKVHLGQSHVNLLFSVSGPDMWDSSVMMTDVREQSHD